MTISQQLRKDNIVGYLLYMWQVEDTIRAYQCDLSAIKRDYISRFDLTDEQREETIDWYGNLILLATDFVIEYSRGVERKRIRKTLEKKTASCYNTRRAFRLE